MTTSLDRPGVDHAPLTQQERVGEARRDLLDVVGDQDGRRRVGVEGEHGQGRDEVLTTAEVQPGGRLVEQQELGVGHQGTRDLDALALALAEGAEGALGQLGGADLGQQLGGPVVVELGVVLAPAAHDAVRRGDDDVPDQLGPRDPVGERCTGQPDARPQVEHVRRAEHLVEDAGHSGRRVDLGAGDLQEGRLAGTVGPEHHPALVLLDLPGDVVEQHGSSHGAP